MPIDVVHLVAVNQHPDLGSYTWDHIADLPLRPSTVKRQQTGV